MEFETVYRDFVDAGESMSRQCPKGEAPPRDARTKLAAFFTILLRENSDDTYGSAGTIGNLHGKGHQTSAGRRDLLELRHIFEAIQTRAAYDSMNHKILRRTIVDAGRVDPNSVNVSFAHQKLLDFL